MTIDSSPHQENLFQTPNPDELKKAAKEDPIAERAPEPIAPSPDHYSESDADVLTPEILDENYQNQVVKANLSGH